MGWLFLALLTVIGVVAISVYSIKHKTDLEHMRTRGKAKGMPDAEIEAIIAAEKFPIPPFVRTALIGATFVFVGLGTFNSIFFYAEPGYIYHVRTILGEERVIDDVGYAYHLFGRVTEWKKALTVQATAKGDHNEDGERSSANLPPLNVVMLDQVDAAIEATTRFRIPTEHDTFLRMAHEYRTPENLLNTALVPAFKETLQATGSLMAAEEYYSGRRTEFNAEFEYQMQDGIYLVTRHQITVTDETAHTTASAAANKGSNQDEYGNNTKTKWVVEKQRNSDGSLKRKVQNFTDYGIHVIEARVTDLVPNEKYVDRMKLKQQAAADRAIAQERRVQEEEQRLLAIAKGDREIAERQADAKKEQIGQTTKAETEKQLALIAASRQLEQANIDKQTAQIQKEQAEIDAQRIKILADADKYEREARIKGDNALQQKLDTEVKIHQVWADAYAKRSVPTTVIGGGSGGAPVGSDSEASTFMQLMTIDAAKRLNYDRDVSK